LSSWGSTQPSIVGIPVRSTEFVVRTSCVEREERIEHRWETAKWLGLPGRNVLIEVYGSSAAPAKHKKTAHYQTWRDTVAEMMAEPRSSVKYSNIFPGDESWGQLHP
jgi:hypothetical protein